MSVFNHGVTAARVNHGVTAARVNGVVVIMVVVTESYSWFRMLPFWADANAHLHSFLHCMSQVRVRRACAVFTARGGGGATPAVHGEFAQRVPKLNDIHSCIMTMDQMKEQFSKKKCIF